MPAQFGLIDDDIGFNHLYEISESTEFLPLSNQNCYSILYLGGKIRVNVFVDK